MIDCVHRWHGPALAVSLSLFSAAAFAAETRPESALRPAVAACPAEEDAFARSAKVRSALTTASGQEEIRRWLSEQPLEIPRGCGGDAVCGLRLDLAEARLQLQDADGALTALDGAITGCGPSVAIPALRRAGSILVARHDDPRAINYYARYLEKVEGRGEGEGSSATEIAEVRKNLVRALHRAGEDTRALREAQDSSLERWPAEAGPDDLVVLSEIFEAERRWEPAAAFLERFVNVFSSDARRLGALVRLGRARAALGQSAQARFLFNLVIQEAHDTDAALESRLELLDLAGESHPVDPAQVERTLQEIATQALDDGLAARAVRRFLGRTGDKKSFADRLSRLADWGRAVPPLRGEAVTPALDYAVAFFAGDAASGSMRMLAAVSALEEIFGGRVFPPRVALGAARSAYRSGFFEQAAMLAAAAEPSAGAEEADEIMTLRLRSLIAARRLEEAAETGRSYLEVRPRTDVVLETCRALRALGRWDDLLRCLDGDAEAAPEIGARALMTLWRVETLWNMSEEEEAARRALVFVRAQADRAPDDATGARGTLAKLALFAGDGFYGAGLLEDAAEAYAYAEDLGAGSWPGDAGRIALARVEKDLPPVSTEHDEGGPQP